MNVAKLTSIAAILSASLSSLADCAEATNGDARYFFVRRPRIHRGAASRHATSRCFDSSRQ